jgi:hypothetical protein
LFPPSFTLSSGNLGVQSVHASRPQRSVVIEPRVKLRKRLRAQGVDPELSLLVHLDKSGVA